MLGTIGSRLANAINTPSVSTDAPIIGSVPGSMKPRDPIHVAHAITAGRHGRRYGPRGRTVRPLLAFPSPALLCRGLARAQHAAVEIHLTASLHGVDNLGQDLNAGKCGVQLSGAMIGDDNPPHAMLGAQPGVFGGHNAFDHER